MVQQTVESKFSECGLGNTETNLSSSDKQFPVAVKKTALRDVQNENRIPSKIENSAKDKVSVDAVKAAGTKRSLPKDPVSPPRYHQSPNSNAANAQLVYVRRKFETETSKSSASEIRTINAVDLNSGQQDHVEDASQSQLKMQLTEPKVSSFSAFSPMPVASLTTASGKPSVPFPVNSNTRSSPAESNYNHVASPPLVNNLKGIKNLHWEERYHQLHVLLKKIDETDQEDYLQSMYL